MSSIKKKLGIFGSLLLAYVLVVMTVLSTPSLAATYPLTLTDDLGREVTIEAFPERIISIAPSNTEILFALGLADRVVGVTDFCDYPPEAQGKEKIGGPWTPIASAYGAEQGDLNYNPIGDFDNNGHIDFFDFIAFAGNYGT